MNDFFKIEKTKLNKILEYVNVISKTELNIKITQQTWYIQIANVPIYTSIIDIQIPHTSFLEYNLTESRKISINYSSLFKILKSLGEHIILEISAFQLKIYNPDQENNQLCIAMLDSDFDPVSLDLDFNSSFNVNLQDFNSSLVKVAKMSEKIKIKFNPEQKYLILQSEDNYSKGFITWNVPVTELDNILSAHTFSFNMKNQFVKFVKLTTENSELKYNDFFVIQLKIVEKQITYTGTFSLVQAD